MTPEQIEQLGPALHDFLQPFLFCCDYTQTFELLEVYCRGLLSDLKAKNCEAIALEAGLPPRNLQQFLKDYAWSYARVRDLLQQQVARQLPQRPDDGLGTLGIVDETGIAKHGHCTPGIQRQWCGERGKTENCIVTVHTGVVRGRYKTLLDTDLFLPQAWDRDRPRCARAGIPEEIRYRAKWRIALEQIDRLRGNGLVFDWFTADENYGSKPGFLQGLQDRTLLYVCEVPRNFRARGTPPPYQRPSSWVEDLVRHSPLFVPQAWQSVRLARQTLGEQVWQVKAAQVWLPWDPSRTYWLIWVWNEATGEEKYYISNAPPSTAVTRLLQVGFGRWHVEHSLRVSKGELGLRDWVGQSYTGLLRHQVLCLVLLSFVAAQAERLRGEKSGGDAGTGMCGVALDVSAVAGAAAAGLGRGPRVEETAVLPAAESGSAAVAAKPGCRAARGQATAGRTPTPPRKKAS